MKCAQLLAVALLCVAVATASVHGGAQNHTEAPPTTPFTTRCAIDVGPVAEAPFLNNFTGMRGAGYGHNAYLFHADIFFIVAAKSYFTNETVPVNSVVLGVFPNCSVVWEFRAGAPVTQAPMHDGQVVAFRTWDIKTEMSMTYMLNTSTGSQIWKTWRAAQYPDCTTSAVHDGRLFVAEIADPTLPAPEIVYGLTAYHLETGSFLWSWMDSNLTSPWDHTPSMFPPSKNTHLWIAYNPEGDKGFVGYGTRVVGFNGVTGWRMWSNNVGNVTYSASPVGGWVGAGSQRALFAVSNDTLFSFNQYNGSMSWAVKFSSTIKGEPSLNKYTNDVCVQQDANVTCVDGVTGAFLFTADAGVSSSPALGFTWKNLIFATGLSPNGVHIQLLNQTTGKVDTHYSVPTQRGVFGAVGYPSLFESGYDVGLLTAGAGKEGTFTVAHFNN